MSSTCNDLEYVADLIINLFQRILSKTLIKLVLINLLNLKNNTKILFFYVDPLHSQSKQRPELKVIVAAYGRGFKPPQYLKAGDVVRVEIDGIGVLENPVKSATPAA